MITFNEFAAKRNRINEAMGDPSTSSPTTPSAAAKPQQPYFNMAQDIGTISSTNRTQLNRLIAGAKDYGSLRQEIATAFTLIEDILDTNVQNNGEQGRKENAIILNKMKNILAKYIQHNNQLDASAT